MEEMLSFSIKSLKTNSFDVPFIKDKIGPVYRMGLQLEESSNHQTWINQTAVGEPTLEEDIC